MSNGNEYAMPQNGAFSVSDDFNSSEDMGGCGLTKREYFAIMALQGLISVGQDSPSKATRHAVRMADALLEELQHG